MANQEEEVLGKAYDARLMRRLLGYLKPYTWQVTIALTAFVSPYRAHRDAVRRQVERTRPGSFVEVFVDVPLEICEARDPKGLYKKARAGELRNFTGIDDPYEPPLSAELRLEGANNPPAALAEEVLAFLHKNGKISRI